ncbi:Lrp/AsnC family transcriptional regulator [Cumulibacter manganitolerans]|uniref:Lrp/AsnC family transcriptional regulator n=1 Tax=Cumulibacter manganitolerans TaxID=1884992 RepID=UPI0012957994|nr:Lrp/AsnC ligand binding domain-containing protein [Cumulibacter manganitolerans]
MITAIVMITAATSEIPETAARLAAIDGVSEVYSVAGGVDLIAIVRVREFEDIARVVSGEINKAEGVIETDTHIAFQAFSQHDLESTFSLGLD